jgi:Leucine-rich repeat (LRR) protein
MPTVHVWRRAVAGTAAGLALLLTSSSLTAWADPGTADPTPGASATEAQPESREGEAASTSSAPTSASTAAPSAPATSASSGEPVGTATSKTAAAAKTAPSASVPSSAATEPAKAGAHQPGDIMPDGPIKQRLMAKAPDEFPTADSVTYAKTSALTQIPGGALSSLPTDTGPWWTGIDFLPGLTSLSVNGTKVAGGLSFPQGGIAPLLPALTDLSITGPFTPVQFGHSTSVTALTWNFTGAASFSGLPATFPNLQTLTSSISGVTDLEGVAGLSKLQTLAIDSLTNSSSSLSIDGLSGAPELTSLSINGSLTTSFSAFTDLPKLKSVDLSSNRLASIPDFSGAPALKSANLAHNAISAPAWKKGYPGLDSLDLTWNGVKSLQNVLIDPKVSSVNLGYNDFSNLDGLDRFAAVDTLSIGTNSGIPDLSAAEKYKGITAKVSVDSGSVTIPDSVPAGAPISLEKYIILPTGSTASFSGSSVVAGSDPNTFVVQSLGGFQALWTIPSIGNISFSQGTLKGTSALTGLAVTAKGPASPVPTGRDMTFTGTAAGSGAGAVTRYQWYSFPGQTADLNSMTPVANGTGKSLTVVNSKETGPLQYALVAFVGSSPVISNWVDSNAMVDFPDAGLAKCVAAFHGGPLTYTNLRTDAQYSSYDCSGRGITSMEGLQYVHGGSSFNLSHNQITDITPITETVNSVTTGGAFAGISVDLSYNNISDASPLWKNGATGDWMRKDWDNIRYPGGFNLDHNHVSDLSGMSTLPSPGAPNNPVPVSFLNQEITLPNAAVAAPVQVPTVTGPNGKTMAVTSAEGASLTDGHVTYATAGTKTLTWERIQAQYARFSGTFSVNVGATAAGPALTVSPDKPKSGSLMTFTGNGFTPGEQVTFSWDRQTMGTVTANAAGNAVFTWRTLDPSEHGQAAVTANGKTSKGNATVKFTLAADDTVSIPDGNLRGCFTDALGLKPGATLYRSVTDRMEGTLDCRGRGVTDLTGLDAFKNGQILLNGNALTSLTSLPTLSPKVWLIDVSNNAITSTGTLKPQDGDPQIVVIGNQIVDFRDLQKVTLYVQGLAQEITLPMALAGQPVAIPKVMASNPRIGAFATVEYRMPTGATEHSKADGSRTLVFAKPGTYEIGFTVNYTYRNSDGTSAGEDSPWASGVFTVTVVSPHQKVLNINPTTLYAGQMLNATGAGFNPGEVVTFTLGENGLRLDQAIANQWGSARITDAVVPLNTKAGTYRVVATGSTSGVSVWTTLTVKAPPAQRPTDIRPVGMPPGATVVHFGKGGGGGNQGTGPSGTEGANFGNGNSGNPGMGYGDAGDGGQGEQQGPGFGLPATGGDGPETGIPAAVVLLLGLAGIATARRRHG